MKKYNALFYCLMSVIALYSVSGCRFISGCIKGSGNAVTESRKVNSFTKVVAGGDIKIILKQDSGKAGEVNIEADDNIMEHIRTEVSGETLRIEMDDNFCNYSKIIIHLSAADYKDVAFSGSTEIETDGRLYVHDLALHLSGASNAKMEVDADNFETVASGSSEITLAGQTKNLSIKTSGSSDLVLSGKADVMNVQTSGSSSIKGFSLEADKCHLETSGNSDVNIHVINELEVSSSGSSDVKYKGSPARVVNNESGASSLKKVD